MSTRVQGIATALGMPAGGPLRPFVLGFLLALGVTIVAAVGLLAWRPFWALVAGIIAAALAVTLAVLIPFARAYHRRMQRLLAGEFWVRWRFDPGEWERFAAGEWRRARDEARLGALLTPVFAAAMAGIFAVVGGSGSAALLGGGLVLAVGWIVSLGILIAGRVRLARRASEAGEVTIGPLGVHRPGRFWPLHGFNVRFGGARFEPGSPATLRFETRSQSQYGPQAQSFRIPVPADRTAEAVEVVDRLNAHFGVEATAAVRRG